MENQTEKQRTAWVKELETKSWNLEMTISGAATFAVSFLPGLIDRGLDYYFENLAPGTSNFTFIIPVLAYSFFKVMAWMLIGTFILHLCMRALWVGAVGLHSAYPEGIRYEKLHHVSDAYRRMAEERYGTLDAFIVRLDKRCNLIFALAFMMAMGLSAIGILYVVLAVAMIGLKNYLDPGLLEKVASVFYLVVSGMAVALVILQYVAKRRPDRTRLPVLAAKIQLGSSALFMPVFTRPLAYLTMAFMSNTTEKKYMGSIALIMLVMTVPTILVTSQKAGELRDRNLLETRDFYSSGSQAHKFQQAEYDNLREADAELPLASIPADVVEGRFLPLFLKYPEYLDERLGKFCQVPAISDTLPGSRRRFLLDSLRLQCLSAFFQVRLNDSLRLSPEWMFGEKHGSKGLIGYLETGRFQPGKNRIEIRMPSVQKQDSLVSFANLPFWFPGK